MFLLNCLQRYFFLLLLLIGNFFIYKKRQDVISAVKLVQKIDCSAIIFSLSSF